MKNDSRGFTLIELLVVIAVIGILAAVVLASLGSARSKGKIASVKSNLRNAISAAEMHFNDNGNYNTLCAVGGPLQSTIDSIIASGGKAGCYTYDGKRWALSAATADTNLTVTSSGVSTFDTATGAGATWDNANASCAASGKKLPTIEQMKALYTAHNGPPPNFTTGVYWSSTEHATTTTSAWYIHMEGGTYPGSISYQAKTQLFRVYCIS